MSAAAASLTGAQDFSRPTVNPWLIGITVSMAAFLEVLDTSVANVALPYIAGNLGASYDALVNQQAHTLSFMDTFWVLGMLCAIMFVLAFFLKKNDPGAGGDIAVG